VTADRVDPNRRATLKRMALAAVTAGGVDSLWGASPPPAQDLVVLLPGIMGSVLQSKGKDVWALSAQGAYGALKSLGEDLTRLTLNGDTPDAGDIGDDVVATALFSDVHLIPGLWKIDGYDKVRAALARRVELRPGQNYVEFPYDWRRDNRSSARKLAKALPGFLENWRKASGNAQAKVTFIAHSMGGLVARYYIECLGGWQVTRQLITFGTPFRGSLNAVDFLSNGYPLGVAGIQVGDMSALVRSFTSVYQLMPRYPCVDLGDKVLRRPGETSRIPNVDVGRAKAALEFHREIDAAVARNAALPEYAKSGYVMRPIVGMYQRTKQAGRIEGGKLVMKFELNGRDEEGDGTVPAPSAIPLGGDAAQQKAIDNGAAYFAGLHASLQNLEPVGVHASALLLDRNFDGYRSAPRYALHVQDAYHEKEPVILSCSSGSESNAVVSVLAEKGAFRRVRDGIKLRRDEPTPVEVGQLEPGSYRAMLSIPGQPPLTDVFVVTV
jgi:hypothetical protein